MYIWYEGPQKVPLRRTLYTKEEGMLHWFHVYIFFIPLYIHMWTFEGMEQTINIIIRIKSSLSHIYIDLYLKMRIKKGGVNFHICRVALESFLYITILSISQHWCNFKVRLKVWKRHAFGIKCNHPKRRNESCITIYCLLCKGLWNVIKQWDLWIEVFGWPLYWNTKYTSNYLDTSFYNRMTWQQGLYAQFGNWTLISGPKPNKIESKLKCHA